MEFYKKQPGMKFIGGDNKGGMFKKGRIGVTIQNPWIFMKTGKKNQNTLIFIVKTKE